MINKTYNRNDLLKFEILYLFKDIFNCILKLSTIFFTIVPFELIIKNISNSFLNVFILIRY
jgi:hypothetical protein